MTTLSSMNWWLQFWKLRNSGAAPWMARGWTHLEYQLRLVMRGSVGLLTGIPAQASPWYLGFLAAWLP